MSEEKYTLKIQSSLKNVFQRFIDTHSELGYRSVSQYLVELIRNDAKRLLELEKQEQGGKKE